MDPEEAFQLGLDCGDAINMRTFAELEGVFAATRTGLHRSTDGGEDWEKLDVPQEEVFAIEASPDEDRLYAGTHPAHLYISMDAGETWEELGSLQNQPSRETWHTPRHRNAAHVRTLAVHPAVPERVVAGIEVGGIHVSDDAGETWTERRADLEDERDDDLQYDVHHVLMPGPDTFFASCGHGYYRTQDTGETWTRLDSSLEHHYFHTSILHEDELFVAAEMFPPGPYGEGQDPGGSLFVSTDKGTSFDPVSYPGAPQEVVTALGLIEGSLVAGTSRGRLLKREDVGWAQLGHVPGWVRAIVSP